MECGYCCEGPDSPHSEPAGLVQRLKTCQVVLRVLKQQARLHALLLLPLPVCCDVGSCHCSHPAMTVRLTWSQAWTETGSQNNPFLRLTSTCHSNNAQPTAHLFSPPLFSLSPLSPSSLVPPFFPFSCIDTCPLTCAVLGLPSAFELSEVGRDRVGLYRHHGK